MHRPPPGPWEGTDNRDVTAVVLVTEKVQFCDRPQACEPSVVGTGVDPVTSRFSGARSTN